MHTHIGNKLNNQLDAQIQPKKLDVQIQYQSPTKNEIQDTPSHMITK